MLKTVIFIITGLLSSHNCISQTVVPFEYYQRLIFFKVKVNKEDSLLFLFDTGANASAIDEKVADNLHLKTQKVDSVEGTAGIIVVPYVKVKSLCVGKSIVKNLSLTKYDLAGSLAPPGQKLAGILGTDFLKHFVVTIDFKSRKISFSKKYSGTSPVTIPFELDQDIPRIKALINDRVSSYFRYDSGSSLFETNDIYMNTTTQIFEDLLKSDSMLKPSAYLSATGVGGTIEIPVYKIQSVQFGGIELKQPFLLIQPQQGYFARPDAVGFFGNNLFEKFQRVTIDFLHKNIYANKMVRK